MSDLNSLLTKDFEEQEKKNREKYGPRGEDHITHVYARSIEAGDTWCLENVLKYLKRYLSASSKSKNKMDLLKSLDYISRAIDANNKAGTYNQTKEIIDK